jgi:NAD dependent epimerase/dehydratase family enzyme
MANPFPFVAGSVLQASELNGIGETTAYTPTWTNLTVGNGTQSWKYIRINDTIQIVGSLIFGSTTSVTGLITHNFPVAVDTTTFSAVIGWATFQDTGIGTYPAAIYQLGSNQFGIYAVAANGTYVGPIAASSATVPFTWANTDEIRINLIYKAA